MAPQPQPEPQPQPQPQPTKPTLTEAKKPDLQIGGQWTEVSLIGTLLNIGGLKAFITDPAAPTVQDVKILIEQPEEDAIKEKLFPIVVKVLPDAAAGYRNVVLALSLSDLKANGDCKALSTKCAVLKNGMNLIY